VIKKSEKSYKNMAKKSKFVQNNPKFSKFFKIFTKTCPAKNLQTIFQKNSTQIKDL